MGKLRKYKPDDCHGHKKPTGKLGDFSMKRIPLFLFLILSVINCFAQTQIDPTYQIQWNLLSGAGAPTITCTQNGNYTVYPYGAEWGQSYQDTTNNAEYKCTTSGWVKNLPATGGTLTGPLVVGTGALSITLDGSTGNGTFSGTVAATTAVASVNGVLNVKATPYGASGSMQSTTASASIPVGSTVPVTSCIDFAAGQGVQIQGTQVATTGNVISGTNQVVVASAAGISVGQLVTANGIPNYTYVAPGGISGTTITLTKNAVGSRNGAIATFIPFYVGTATGCSSGSLAVTPATSAVISSGAMVRHDDTASLQVAASALVSGQSLYTPFGTYNLSGTVTINGVPYGNISGPGEWNQTLPNTTSLVLEASNNFTINGNAWFNGYGLDYVNTGGGTTAGILAQITTSSSVSVSNSTFSNFGTVGIEIFAATSPAPTNFSADNVSFIGPGSSVIPSGGNGNFSIYASGNGGVGLKVTNNIATGMGFLTFVYTDWTGLIFSNNIAEPAGEAALYSYGDDGTVTGNTVLVPASNTTGGCFVFRHFINNHGSVGLNVSDNFCSAAGQTGLSITPTSGLVVASTPCQNSFSQVTIHHNTFVGGAITPIDIENICYDTSHEPPAYDPAFDIADLTLDHNTVVGDVTSSGRWGINATGITGTSTISDNLVDGAYWACIYAQVDGPVSMKNNRTSNCGIQNSGGYEYQANIALNAYQSATPPLGAGTVVMDGNESYAGGGQAVFSVGAYPGTNVQLGPNNISSLPVGISGNQIAWPPPVFYEYSSFPTQPDNYILWSEAFNHGGTCGIATSPWVCSAEGLGTIPVITPAPSVVDPLGNTGTVQEVYMNTGSSVVTSGADASSVSQVVAGVPNPHNGVVAVCYENNGTGTRQFILEDSTTGHVAPYLTVLTALPNNGGPNWTCTKLPVTVAGTTDTFLIQVRGDLTPGIADIMVYGAQIPHNGGKYVQTTTAAIDNTPYFPFVNGWSRGTTAQTVPISGTPSAGQIPIATGSNTATWQTSPFSASAVSTVASAACAFGGDTTVGSTVITGGTATTLVVGSLPAYFKATIGSPVIGVIGTTTTGGTLDTSGTSYYTATSWSGNTLNFASLPATWSSGGTIFLGCANAADAIASGSAVTFANQSPNVALAAGGSTSVKWQYSLFSAAATPTYRFNSLYGGAAEWTSAGTAAPVVTSAGIAGEVTLNSIFDSSTQMSTTAVVTAPNNSSGNASVNSTPQPVGGLTSGSKYSLSVYFSATGCCSGAFAYVSGGSPSGTGNVTLGTFNGACSGTTATMAVSSNVPGAITFTNTGQSCTSLPTTATCTSGTATCSGTMTFTGGALRGAQGNALMVTTSKQGQ
jgi:hypothetical protein